MRNVLLSVVIMLGVVVHAGCVAPSVEDADVGVSEGALEVARARVAGFEEADPSAIAPEERSAILARYAEIPHSGVREELFERAVLYYDKNVERIPNKRWLSILDFSRHSRERRFFVLDMDGGPMASHPVAHGKLSDPDDDGVATVFSNVNGSNQSSIGFYLTAETYLGSNGRSLRLDGLSTTNSLARERLIVIHGADYVEDGRPKQGRSLGCPAFPHAIAQPLIDQVKAGSLIYAWN